LGAKFPDLVVWMNKSESALLLGLDSSGLAIVNLSGFSGKNNGKVQKRTINKHKNRIASLSLLVNLKNDFSFSIFPFFKKGYKRSSRPS
jgi:hypothetical protein